MAYNNDSNFRVLYHDTFEGKGFTDENSLATARLTRPDKVNPTITFLQGNPSKKFPLTFLTEAQTKGVDPIAINDIQYEWDTFKTYRKPSTIIGHGYGAGDKPGVAGSPILIDMEDDWLKYQHTVQTPNGTQLRVDSRAQRLTGKGGSGFRYTFQLITNNRADYVDVSELTYGNKLSMIGLPAVSESNSMGNESNKAFPGKMKNQITIMRKSKRIAGNYANKTVEVQFNVGGKLTNYWAPFEEWQFELEVKEMAEEAYWFYRYNRAADGTIMNTDPDNGLPIPYGAGVEYQIPHRDTYSKLTVQRLKNTVGDIFYGATDQENMVVTLYTGYGGMEEFHDAIMAESGGFATLLSGAAATEFVKRAGGGLSFGAYFKVYEHVDGHMIVLKHLNLLDKGGRADNAPKHPVSGRPITSYDMYYIDQSTYDGVRNVQMVTQKGRGMIRGILKGMAPVPDHFKWNGNSNSIATERDESSLHLMMAKGIKINRNTHCFKLEFDSSQGV